jgi:hypothetical protein
MPNPENILGQGFHTNPERINKSGANKGSRWLKTRLKQLLEVEDRGDKVLFALIDKAITGDTSAIREILDRIDGKVTQENEHSGGITIRFENPGDYVYPSQDQGDSGEQEGL